jgi:hypothetical protein
MHDLAERFMRRVDAYPTTVGTQTAAMHVIALALCAVAAAIIASKESK